MRATPECGLDAPDLGVGPGGQPPFPSVENLPGGGGHEGEVAVVAGVPVAPHVFVEARRWGSGGRIDAWWRCIVERTPEHRDHATGRRARASGLVQPHTCREDRPVATTPRVPEVAIGDDGHHAGRRRRTSVALSGSPTPSDGVLHGPADRDAQPSLDIGMETDKPRLILAHRMTCEEVLLHASGSFGSSAGALGPFHHAQRTRDGTIRMQTSR